MSRPPLQARPIAFEPAADGDASGAPKSPPFGPGDELASAIGGRPFAITTGVR